MFEYVLAGFTGSFFSYFCVFLGGIQFYACARGTSGDIVIEHIDRQNDMFKRDNERVERKVDVILRQLTHGASELFGKN